MAVKKGFFIPSGFSNQNRENTTTTIRTDLKKWAKKRGFQFGKLIDEAILRHQGVSDRIEDMEELKKNTAKLAKKLQVVLRSVNNVCGEKMLKEVLDNVSYSERMDIRLKKRNKVESFH